jgi:hypothetical protein
MSTEIDIEKIKQLKGPVIVWEKWQDPFDNEETQAILNKLREQHEEEQEENGFHQIKSKEAPEMFRVLMDPNMGLIPVTDLSQPGRTFNFWMGTTNFNLSEELAKVIEETPGVELLDIVTRYRFRIGIGKIFKDSDVFNSVLSRIKRKMKNMKELTNLIYNLKKQVSENGV